MGKLIITEIPAMGGREEQVIEKIVELLKEGKKVHYITSRYNVINIM